jgi:glycosyltransferase involved in cell wall biosynthesis
LIVKILYVITGLGVGGAETQLSAVAQRLAEYHEICICYFTGEHGVPVDVSRIHVVGLDIKKTIFGVFNGYLALRKLIADFRPDVVHGHMIHANILSRLARLTIKFPRLICTAHNTYEGGMLRMLAYRLTDRLADVTTNVSLEAVQAFEKLRACPKGKMQVVFNGIDTTIFKRDDFKREHVRRIAGAQETDRVILSVGRLAEAKDFPTLIACFAALSGNDGTLRLWIVGEGCERVALTALVEELGVTEKITFWGARSDVDAFYNAADIYVLSSAWEGFGLVVAEAMATERVVVATDCGGVREVIGDQGFVVPPRDVPSLTKGIARALSLSDEEKRVLGLRARARVIENFSLDNVVANWLHLYESR